MLLLAAAAVDFVLVFRSIATNLIVHDIIVLVKNTQK